MHGSRLYFAGWALLFMGAGLSLEAKALARAAARLASQAGQGGTAPRRGLYRLAGAALFLAGAYLIYQSGGGR